MEVDKQELDNLSVGEVEKYLQIIVARFINEQEIDIDSKEEYQDLVKEIHSRIADLTYALKSERKGGHEVQLEKVLERLEDKGIRK